MLSVLLTASRAWVLVTVFTLIGLIALADHLVGSRASLGLLYVFPIVIAAVKLRPAQIVALAVLCAVLRTLFYIPAPELEVLLRFPFALLVYAGAGLFVIAIIRNRGANMDLLSGIQREQELRREVEEQLRILVESSPATIVTLDSHGVVLAANNAAKGLLMLSDGETLRGRNIRGYLPVLSDALQFDPGPAGLRTAAQCQGVRENGEIFLASTWFSSWNGPDGKRLAAIIVDSSEDMRDREEESLRQLLRANQIAAAAISHEVRNLCSAISVISGNLREKHLAAGTAEPDADMQALTSLVSGLERIAAVELNARSRESLDEMPLQAVLDDLRIVIEPQWRESGGKVRWRLPLEAPRVLAERHGLLQAFLNLSQNSLRAVQDCAVRELTISVSVRGENSIVTFEDSGLGVSAPERLFAPFQPGAEGTGIGLYVSRAVVRGYGGDLRWEPTGTGSRFAVELQSVKDMVNDE
ncbi:MAG: two-component system, LuxR family, sensor kinase FixL [Bryobacterales bacterium]|nr:two-component system, LuxR family, sensor kinase FixL [Bryobacterales bacterium]